MRSVLSEQLSSGPFTGRWLQGVLYLSGGLDFFKFAFLFKKVQSYYKKLENGLAEKLKSSSKLSKAETFS